MDQVPVGATEECFSIGAEEMVAHSEEVVTSNEETVNSTQPAALVNHQLPPTLTQSPPVYNIPTIIASPGPIMQVVTLQTVQQPASPQVGLTNTLRNIRLIAIQPKLPFNKTNGRAQPISLQATPRTEIKIQPQPQVKAQLQSASQPHPNELNKKVTVNSFYSKLKPALPVTLAPKVPRAPRPPQPPQQQQHVVKPSPSFYKEQQREREMKEFSHLNEELQRGLRIFLDLTTSLHHNTTWPFMERVDPIKDGAPDYDHVIKKPMWLSLIKEKFRKNQYMSIDEFVADMRLIMENCYRYNGPNHPVTKKALRLEQSLEQKLALLPSDLRTKCAIVEAESERKARPGSSEAYFSILLHRVRHEREQREQLAKEKKAEEQRLRREEKERQRCLWAERMMNPQVKSQMRTMWEIPQIGHFLHLARGALHIGEIAQYELEHMFLMPEASALLATLMTSLLSSPNQRIKLAESPPTPYTVWSAKIGSRVAEWYRTYNREGRQFVKLHESIGLEPMFWRVCGDTNPLEGGRLYHQLSFLKRVWIFKGLCDTVAHSHKTVQEAMAEEEGPESRQVTLGMDANGFTYLHFPAVSGSDIRVYRQKTWDLELDPIWGPIAAERREAEEQRIREEELKAAELRKRKRASTASKRMPTISKKNATPAKKKTAARPNVNTTPVPQKKKTTSEERPSRIGTRVSPRTLQRQTGLTLYKDTSSESEEEGSDEEPVSDGSDGEEELVENAVVEEEEPAESVVTVAKSAQRKRRGRRTRGRKRPVKKKLVKIVEETEDANNDEEMAEIKEDEASEKAGEEEEQKDSKKIEDDEKTAEHVKSEPDVKKETTEEKDKELSESKPSPLSNGDVLNDGVEDEENNSKENVHQEQEAKEDLKEKVEDDAMEEVVKEEVKEEVNENLVKMETEEIPTAAPTQRFTVSQLVQKLAPSETEEPLKVEDSAEAEVIAPTSQASGANEDLKPIETPAETESVLDSIPDPERTSYDPYFFELIISSVEELQEWITKFSDSSEEDEDRKPRPRCEIKLRERLQSLLEEAQPLASDQQQANQKICQQLWKEWERYRSSSSPAKSRGSVVDGGDQLQDSGRSESDSEQDDDDISSEDDDGVRHSRRLRVKRNRNVANGSHQSTRSSSPLEEEPASKLNRKSSYHFDPEWESDPSTTPEVPAGRKRSNFVPEMKNPDYWVGRRVTRATAAFVDVPEENSSPPAQSPNQQEPQNRQEPQPTESPNDKSTSLSVQSEQLINQLRQLRRQQALLSSNDPRPSGSTGTSNGSSGVFFPSKDGQLLRITNPRAAELLSKLRMTQPAKTLSPASPPSKIFIQQRPPQNPKPGSSPTAPKSIDITNLVTQAAQKGLIVAHEPRRLSMDIGEHGLYMVTAQMTPNGPKVISATPMARKPRIISNPTSPKPVSTASPAAFVDPATLTAPPAEPKANNPTDTTLAVPTISATPDTCVTLTTQTAPVVAQTTEILNSTTSVAPSNDPEAPETLAAQNTPKINPSPVVPTTPVLPTVKSVASLGTPTSNGSPTVKQVLVNDPRQNNIISAEVLCSVAGPEAVGAKLTIVKEGNTKMLTLILSNGEIRRLTNSQVQQIQAAVRNQTKPSNEAS